MWYRDVVQDVPAEWQHSVNMRVTGVKEVKKIERG